MEMPKSVVVRFFLSFSVKSGTLFVLVAWQQNKSHNWGVHHVLPPVTYWSELFLLFPWMWISIAMIRNIATDAATVGRPYRHLLQWHSFCLLLHCHADLIAQGKVSSTKLFLLGSIRGWHTCPYGPNIAWSASCLWVRREYTRYCEQINAETKQRPNAKQLYFIFFYNH